jgi:hypothetical protein
LIPAGVEVWSLSSGGGDSLGRSCTAYGLFLGRTRLIERRAGHYAVRPRADLERLFGRAYRGAGDLDRLMPGLAVIKSALDEKNLCLAQIAAVQLRVPALPDRFARAGLEAEDRLIKTEQGHDILARGGWDPAAHPRAGAPPNRGWFAPTGGSSAAGTQIVQGEEDERVPEEILDPIAPVRQAQWDARVETLRRLDPNNPNLVFVAPPGAPSPEAVARLDAELTAVAARVANKIANGHAFAGHIVEFPEISSQSQFAQVIQRVISNPSSDARPLSNGRTAYYEKSTNTLVIVDTNAADLGTAFRPARGIDYTNQLQ